MYDRRKHDETLDAAFAAFGLYIAQLAVRHGVKRPVLEVRYKSHVHIDDDTLHG